MKKTEQLIRFGLASLAVGLFSTQMFGLLHYRIFPTPLDSLFDSILALKGSTAFAESAEALAVSSDQQFVVVGGNSDAHSTIRVLHFPSGGLLHTFKQKDSLVSLALSTNRENLVGGYINPSNRDKTILIWNLKTNSIIRTLKTGTDQKIALGEKSFSNPTAIDQNGRLLAAGDGKIVRLWDVQSGSSICELKGHSENVLDIAISADSQSVVSFTGDELNIWDRVTCKPIHVIKNVSRQEGLSPEQEMKNLGMRSRLAVSSDGKMVASTAASNIRVWDIQTGREIRALEGSQYLVSSIAFSPSSHYLASGGDDRTLRIWDIQARKVIRTLRGASSAASTGGVSDVVFSPDGQMVIAAGSDRVIRWWQVNLK